MEKYIGWQCLLCKSIWAPFVNKCNCQAVSSNETVDDDKTFCRTLIEKMGTATCYTAASNICFFCDSYQKERVGHCMRGDITNPGYSYCPLFKERGEY